MLFKNLFLCRKILVVISCDTTVFQRKYFIVAWLLPCAIVTTTYFICVTRGIPYNDKRQVWFFRAYVTAIVYSIRWKTPWNLRAFSTRINVCYLSYALALNVKPGLSIRMGFIPWDGQWTMGWDSGPWDGTVDHGMGQWTMGWDSGLEIYPMPHL